MISAAKLRSCVSRKNSARQAIAFVVTNACVLFRNQRPSRSNASWSLRIKFRHHRPDPSPLRRREHRGGGEKNSAKPQRSLRLSGERGVPKMPDLILKDHHSLLSSEHLQGCTSTV